MPDHQVVVVGGGNAGLCAALAARERGSSVILLERAPVELSGGDSRFTAGAGRIAHNGINDLLTLIPDLSQDLLDNVDFESYPASAFMADMGRLTEYRTDPDLAEILVDQSLPVMQWLREKGLRFLPSLGRQSFEVDGRHKFWGGMSVEVSGGGPGLVESLTKAAMTDGVEIRYGARALSLIADDRGVHGVHVRQDRVTKPLLADAVVLACGGFQANTEMRTRYLGPGWDLAKVRGTRFDTGDGIQMALAIGASSAGNWSGCHAVAWDLNAPEFGDLSVGGDFQKNSDPWGIVVNATGRRFMDEGADYRTYTYAKYGRGILAQPNQFAWQIFDSKIIPLLRDEYRIARVTKVRADTLEELASKLDGVDPRGFLDEVARYNAAVEVKTPFAPHVKDGRGAHGLSVPKSNWANTLDEPPFEAYAVTCGITFTFGGLRIDNHARVLDSDHEPIPNLFAAGEIVGGLFYFNYPSGTGLASGAVFGRIAGQGAAQ